MTELSARRTVGERPEQVQRVLLDIAHLAEWNPAVLRITTQDTRAVQGRVYELVTRVPGRATLVYEDVRTSALRWRLTVSGGVELGAWLMREVPGGTDVQHTITHSGATFSLLKNSMRLVPHWRLARLHERLRMV